MDITRTAIGTLIIRNGDDILELSPEEAAELLAKLAGGDTSAYPLSKITDENVDDIMTTAAYGGITYWATEPTQADFALAKPGEHTIVDPNAEDEGECKVFHLSPDKIRQATVEVAEGKHTNDQIRDYVRSAFDNWTEEDGIDCGDIDADAADCIVQVACFGKIVYG